MTIEQSSPTTPASLPLTAPRWAVAMDRWLRPGAWVALEIGHDQADAVASILAASGAERITTHQDYNGHDRVVTARIDRAESGD